MELKGLRSYERFGISARETKWDLAAHVVDLVEGSVTRQGAALIIHG